MTRSAPTATTACPQCRAIFRRRISHCPRDGAALTQDGEDPLLGFIFADRYSIETLVGEGAMGRVYRARHTKISKHFAIKVLYGEHIVDEGKRARFLREAELASRLEHPTIVSVFDYGESADGLLYLAMGYVEGVGLNRLVAKEAPLAVDRVRNLFQQLCEGLAHAHQRGVVHRDLKSENIVVVDGDRLRIVDFGIAIADEGVHSDRLTREGMMVGTPAYMAPEQVVAGPIDHRTDLYSLGVVLYEMLSGALPFGGKLRNTLEQVLTASVPPIATRVPGLRVDPTLEAIAIRLMSKRPEHRFQNAISVLEAVDPTRVSLGSGVNASYSEAETTQVIDNRRSPVVPLVGLAVVLCISSFAVVTLVGKTDQKNVEQDVLAASASTLTKTSQPPKAREAQRVTVPATPVRVDSEKTVAEPTSPRLVPTPRTVAKKKRKNASSKAGSQRKVVAVAPSEPSSKEVQTLYIRVGQELNRLNETNPSQAARLRDVYFSIPLSDALRTPSLRAEVIVRLKRLRKQISK